MPIEKLRPSFTFTEDRLKELQAVVPEAFADGKINWDVLREALGEYLEEETQEHFGLSWPGKRDARRLAAMPSKGTLIPVPGEGINEETTHNIFIEGENLEVLKLLQKSYAGRIKMIYIDPPYNTGNDFVYPDDYSEPLEAYLRRTGQVNEAGKLLTTNSYTSGRYHSNWLNMMYPRLLIAKQLLKRDGLLFISIDDHELYHLQLIMNEIFGEESFKNTIIVRRGIKNVQAQFITIDSLTVGHEYILMYARNAEARFPHFRIELEESRMGSWNNHWRGTDRPTMRYELFGIIPETGQWRWSKERSLAAIDNYLRLIEELGYSEKSDIPQEEIDAWYLSKIRNNEDIDLLRLSRNNKPEHYVPPSETKMGSDLWTDLGTRNNEFAALMGRNVFDTPKPVEWLKRMIGFATVSDDHDIVMDFFAGSGTTGHAVLAQNLDDGGNRKFMMIQLPEPTPIDSPARKAGFETIAEISKERIRRVIKNMKEKQEGHTDLIHEEDLGFGVFSLEHSNFRDWHFYEGQEVSQLGILFDRFEIPLVDGWKKESLLFEIVLLQGFPLDSKIIGLDKYPRNQIQRVHSEFCSHDLFICLDAKIEDTTIQQLNLRDQDIFVCLDTALSDEAKIQLTDRCNLKVI